MQMHNHIYIIYHMHPKLMQPVILLSLFNQQTAQFRTRHTLAQTRSYTDPLKTNSIKIGNYTYMMNGDYPNIQHQMPKPKSTWNHFSARVHSRQSHTKIIRVS